MGETLSYWWTTGTYAVDETGLFIKYRFNGDDLDIEIIELIAVPLT